MAQGGGGARGDDAELTLLMLVGIFVFIAWGLWAMLKQPMIEGIRVVKGAELFVFQLVDPSLAQDYKLLWSLKNDQEAVAQIEKRAVEQKREVTVEMWKAAGYLAPDVLWSISNRVGEYTRWVISAVLVGAAIFFMYFSKRTKFCTVWNLETLIKQQAKEWPIITPIVDFSPTDANGRNPGDPVPETIPVFAEALSPEEWVARERIALQDKVPDKDMIRRAFQQQLGPRWTGLSCLTPAQRCLFAAFALKGAQKRKESDALLGRIAVFWNIKTDFSPSAELMQEVDGILADPKYGAEALRVASRHAYRTTALLGTLKWARERGGVLASSAFLWLRAHDRALWYPLNNLGRRAYHTEAAGAMAHYMAEKNAGKALPIPRLETAVATLVQYWGKYTPRVPPFEADKKGKNA